MSRASAVVNGNVPNRSRSPRWLAVCASVLAVGALAQETVNLECPCRFEYSEAGATVTVAVRNFRALDSGDLRVRIAPATDWWPDVGVAPLENHAAADATLESNSYAVELHDWNHEAGEYRLALLLDENQGGSWVQQDHVHMRGSTALPLQAGLDIENLDYLADADGDGVGDLNEELAGTDSEDPDSTPGAVEVDVLALHNRGFAKDYKQDPYTRIRHVMTVANEIYRSSGTGVTLRLVGFVQAEVEDDDDEWSRVDSELAEQLRVEHGADLVVMFRSLVAGGGSCGWAGLGGIGARGYVSLEENGATYATVFGRCGGGTTAHEIGHLMGLGHSADQYSEGAFRWSRGHYVNSQARTGTVMTYGHTFTDRFSDPNRDCRGSPCGVAIGESEGAYAVASLNAVRFQIAAFAPGQEDADEDGVVDAKDAFPNDAQEWQDTDGDGIGNTVDQDDDGDGVVDERDEFPLDASESADRDEDGVGDNGDACPDDPDETADVDGDGVCDNTDAFPDDPEESSDSDGDGVGDNSDEFPDDPTESSDFDGDGIGDNADPDADGDGVANASDIFPVDPHRSDLSSYLIRGEQAADGAGSTLAAGDMDGDSVVDFAIGAPYYDCPRTPNCGAVYLLSGAALTTADAADGDVDRVIHLRYVASQPGSWKFVGTETYERSIGASIVIGDWSNDGWPDLLIGASFHRSSGRWATGAAFLIDGTSLGSLDAADGQTDGLVALGNVAEDAGSWLLVGQTEGHRVGEAAAFSPVLGDDGQPRVVVNAGPSAYVISTAQLAGADAEDGTRDGVVQIENVTVEDGSWGLRGESAYAVDGLTAGDFDGDGIEDLALTAFGESRHVYIVADGQPAAMEILDGVAELSSMTDGERVWHLIGDVFSRRATLTVADLNGDGSPELLLSEVYGKPQIISSADLEAADNADGTVDGIVRFANLHSQPNSPEGPWGQWALVGDIDGDDVGTLVEIGLGTSYRGLVHMADVSAMMAVGRDGYAATSELDASARRTFVGDRAFGAFNTVLSAGDVDGDGLTDLLFGRGRELSYLANYPGEVVLLLAADLAALDAIDGAADGRLLANNVAGDHDGDGLRNTIDPDDDNDGRRDARDDFPLDASEWTDQDGDGFGDNRDAFPEDGNEHIDTDGDGIGDRADTDDDGDGIADDEDDHPLDTDNDGTDNADDPDDDNDGVADADDDLPLDPEETDDTDGDGIGNHADADDDNDGVDDANDAFPLDAAEWADADGDGVGDNADALPNDSDETADFDGDGIGDNQDADDDNDGVDDADDAFPLDAAEWADADGDGVGDNADALPNDPDETMDSDGDGVGDNQDTDDDNDGVADAEDLFPHIAAKSTLTSYKLVGEDEGDYPGFSLAAMRKEGLTQLVVGAPWHDDRGAVYAIAADQLSAADAADGEADRRIALGNIAGVSESWKLLGEEESEAKLGYSAATVGDMDGDGQTELVLGGVALVGAVYVVAASVAETDGDDGDVDGVVEMQSALGALYKAWKLERRWGDLVGGAVAGLGDIDGDGAADLIVGAPGAGTGSAPGAAEVVLATVLRRGTSTNLLNNQDGWRLVGEAARDGAGTSVAGGDVDGDGMAEILIGAPRHDVKQLDEGAVYLLSSLALSDSSARTIELATIAELPNAWKFVGEAAGDQAGASVALAGDMDGDGIGDILIGAPGHEQGAAYLVSGASLLEADEADGDTDGVIDFANVAALANCWKFLGDDANYQAGISAVSAGDTNADGVPDLLILDAHFAYLVSGSQLEAADMADGNDDGIVELKRIAALPDSWKLEVRNELLSRYTPLNALSGKGVGDLDGDGFDDLVISAWWQGDAVRDSFAYVVSATDLPLLDKAADDEDGIVNLELIEE